MRTVTVLTCLGCAVLLASQLGSAQTPSASLQSPSAFSAIADPAMRSRAFFTEAAKVLTHPRCMNCHPAADRPLQGDDRHPHQPMATRGEAGVGTAANPCTACHTERNFTLVERASYRSIPGHPRWQLAPIEMAWEGKSIGEICQQLKDPQRNGGRTLELVHEHAAHDDLVVGLAAGSWAPPRPWHTGAVWSVDQGVDRHRRGVSLSVTLRSAPAPCPRGRAPSRTRIAFRP